MIKLQSLMSVRFKSNLIKKSTLPHLFSLIKIIADFYCLCTDPPRAVNKEKCLYSL